MKVRTALKQHDVLVSAYPRVVFLVSGTFFGSMEKFLRSIMSEDYRRRKKKRLIFLTREQSRLDGDISQKKAPSSL